MDVPLKKIVKRNEPSLPELPGIHKVRTKLAGGKYATYYYAWRGGPRLHGDSPSEIAAEYRKVLRAKTGRTPRRPRIPQPKSTNAARRRACNKAVQNAKARALKKGMQFYLRVEDLYQMGEKQEWACAMSGIKFNLEYDRDAKFTYNPFGISVDRRDCSKGYYAGNIRLVLTAVNFGLNDWGEDIFTQICRAIAGQEPNVK